MTKLKHWPFEADRCNFCGMVECNNCGDGVEPVPVDAETEKALTSIETRFEIRE